MRLSISIAFISILKSDLREQIQTAYQIIISSDKGIGDRWE